MSTAEDIIGAIVKDLESDIGTGHIHNTCRAFLAIARTIDRPCHEACPLGDVCKNYSDYDREMVEAEIGKALKKWKKRQEKIRHNHQNFVTIRIAHYK